MREELARWLGRDETEVEIEQISGGASNLTYRVRVGADDWILRRPPEFVTATSNDMSREWTVLRALESTDVPVPRVVKTCEDTDVLGAPFYLMERLDGIVFRGADDVAHLDEAQSRRCTEALIDVLATLHAVDVEAVGLGGFGRPEGYVARQVRRWSSQWEATKFAEVPELDETARRLAASVPADGPAAIVHGDYSFNNTLFCLDPPTQLQAVLDWELSTLGDPLTDVGMLVLYWGEIGESIWTGTQAHRANPGFGTVDDVLDRYASASGQGPRGHRLLRGPRDPQDGRDHGGREDPTRGRRSGAGRGPRGQGPPARVRGARGHRPSRLNRPSVEGQRRGRGSTLPELRPPSTASSAPVTNPARGDTRNSTASATSSGSPMRPSGAIERLARVRGSSSGSTMGVAMGPGTIALTRIPSSARSRAAILVSPRSAHFDEP